MKKLIIVGSGETAVLAWDYFTRDSEYTVKAFAIENPKEESTDFCDLPLVDLTTLVDNCPPDQFDVFVAIGSKKLNTVREHYFDHCKALGYQCASYVSSKAILNPNVSIGENCLILENNNLQYGVVVNDNSFLWSMNHIGHRTVIERNSFIASGITISGFCRIGANSFIGVGACFADEVTIGDYNYIAMGSIINKSTQRNALVRPQFSVTSKIPASKLERVNIPDV